MFEHENRSRWRRHARRLTPLLAAAALLIGVAACADDEAPSSPDDGQATVAVAQQQEQPTAAPARVQPREQSQQEAQQYVAEQEAEQQSWSAPQEAAEQAQYAAQEEYQEAAQAMAEQESDSSSYSRPRRSSQQREQRSSEDARPAPSQTTFRDYEQLGFVRTAEDDTATFGLDVDRTSYRLALNWAHQGYTIDPDSVRAEEWVNAFDYGYKLPASERFFAITSDWMIHPFDNDLSLVRLAFQAPELPDNTPLNVTLVLDASGSMDEGDRVEIARAAADSICRGLSDRDRIAVVQFSNSVIWEQVVDPTRPDAAAVRRSINQLRPRSSTNVQAGLDLGVQLADEMRYERPDAYNYIILMSDGVANVDATDPFAILNRVGDRDERNPLRLITVGVGIENYNDYLLEQLAQYGNGWYRYLSTPEEARSTFSRENWLALSRPFADATRAQVVWNPNTVGSWRMIGYENRAASDASFDQDRREFAEIPVGAATTVFFEIELTERPRGAPLHLGSVELRWRTPLDGDARSQLHEVLVDDANDSRGWSDEQLALFHLGALVALSSDRYSRLSALVGSDAALVRRELDTAAEALDWQSNQLGDLDAFRDFRFLLNHLRDALPTESRSGYSR